MFNFFKKRPFALHINDSVLQLMRISGNLENPKMEIFFSKNLTPGIVVNGEIKKNEELKVLVLELVNKAKLDLKNELVVSFSEMQSYENTFYYDGFVDEESILGFLYKKMGTIMPVAADQLKYDYIVYGLGDLKIVFMVAIKSDLARNYEKFLKTDCGLNPIAFEPEILSLLRNVNFPTTMTQGYVFISVRDNAINWYLMSKGLIFDSNTANINKLPELIKDLQKSIANFKGKTHQDVKNILIAGAGTEPLSSSLKDLKIQVEAFEKYRVSTPADLQNSSVNDFNILAGAALKKIPGIVKHFEINLFKK
ncbi:MAG: hypothetical protein WC843_00130 [Candidatus Gracilibacteria bacterium]|jgi:hypothetical protein